MFFPIERIQNTMKSLVPEGLLGSNLEREETPLRPGTIINGRYRIESLLRQGGSCRQYAVTLVPSIEISRDGCRSAGGNRRDSCDQLGARRMGKVLRMEVFPGPIDRGTTRRLLQVSHPGIPGIYDVFTIGPNSHVVSESVPGVALDRLKEKLTAERIRVIGISLVQAVAFLHAQGVYSLNLQPMNLEWVTDKARLISLGPCKFESNLSAEDRERLARKDFQALLETLEKLVAEFGDQDHDGRLCRLLVTLEELIEKDELTATEIQEVLLGL